ncbi:diacylglycerol kinase catalytic region [Catenulispora acidiphila DSM 44928]|uniref:Diacylglycerol kinase catalytic region n=1 Tax=Catenulispora acidiphila (strain DSM 44928 / JCM 14897 / NBRC 102108 / NRRL B-24433 / ID139908) TaxID=479433 RepID=C7QCS1_CATAD|nr:diacylglycerol kinase family protein [Catenulispora acidiphila]ACU76534.1 diacylglycerol kinase catalytic region [Catenulispora acidiphila DSM 44928]
MRALLVMNPKATSTTERTREVLAHALAGELDTVIGETAYRGHAMELARAAAEDGVDLIVALGGDGTVNEVVNGILTAELPEGAARSDLGVVPGGSTNVFARALGLPNDPVEATGVLLDAIHENRRRPVSMGLADDRYFTFTAGYGFDAAVVGIVEERRSAGHKSTGSLYIRSALRHYWNGLDRRNPPIGMRLGDGTEIPRLFMAIVTNTSPWTYLGNKPIVITPDSSFEDGLDMFGVTGMSGRAALRIVRQMFTSADKLVRGKNVTVHHDLTEFTLTAQVPTDFQVDGDHLGLRESVTFRAIRDALRVAM